MVMETVRGNMQDRIRKALLSYGTAEISCTVDDLIGKTGLNYAQVYQALYRLQNNMGEIKIIKEDEYNPRSPIIGIKLLKMASEPVITQRIEERKVEIKTNGEVHKIKARVPNLLQYMDKKLAIEKARQEIAKANLDPESTIVFNPDPLGEEAIILLQELSHTKQELNTISMDLDAARSDNRYLKGRMGEEVFSDSGT